MIWVYDTAYSVDLPTEYEVICYLCNLNVDSNIGYYLCFHCHLEKCKGCAERGDKSIAEMNEMDMPSIFACKDSSINQP